MPRARSSVVERLPPTPCLPNGGPMREAYRLIIGWSQVRILPGSLAASRSRRRCHARACSTPTRLGLCRASPERVAQSAGPPPARARRSPHDPFARRGPVTADPRRRRAGATPAAPGSLFPPPGRGTAWDSLATLSPVPNGAGRSTRVIWQRRKPRGSTPRLTRVTAALHQYRDQGG